MWRDLSEWAKRVKMFGSSTTGMLPKGDLREEDFNSQPGPCADDNQPFSQPPTSPPNGLMNKVFGGRDGGAA